VDEPTCLLLVAGGLPEDDDGGEHVVEGVRVDGEHLGPAAEVLQRLVDDRHVHRADGAEVLGDDQVRVEVGQGAGVEMVEVLPGPRPRRDGPVDLCGAEARGQ